MKLKELVKSKEKLIRRDGYFLIVEMIAKSFRYENRITGRYELESLKGFIECCDEFKGCELEFIDVPTALLEIDETLTFIHQTSQVFKVSDNSTFSGKFYLYQIGIDTIIDARTFEAEYDTLFVRGIFEGIKHD